MNQEPKKKKTDEDAIGVSSEQWHWRIIFVKKGGGWEIASIEI